MAVQIGRALGAHVTAAASASGRVLVTEYGAEQFIDYGAADRFEDVVQDHDIVFDTLGGDMQVRSWGLLRPGGILVSTLGLVDATLAAARGVRGTGMGCIPNGAQLERIAALVDGAQVRPNVGAVLTLDEAAKAQELNRTGAVKGKIVLTVD